MSIINSSPPWSTPPPTGGFGDVSVINPSGYIYIKGDSVTNGSWRWVVVGLTAQLQYKDAALGWLVIHDNALNQTTVRGSLRTGLNSLYLGDNHSVGSAGQNVIFKNIETTNVYFPVWQGQTVDGASLINPSVRQFSAQNTAVEVNGALTGTNVNYVSTLTNVANYSYTRVQFVPAETYAGDIRWFAEYTGSGRDIAEVFITGGVTAGVLVDIPFGYPLDTRIGENITTRIVKVVDNTPLLVKAGATNTAQPYRKVWYRTYRDAALTSQVYNSLYLYTDFLGLSLTDHNPFVGTAVSGGTITVGNSELNHDGIAIISSAGGGNTGYKLQAGGIFPQVGDITRAVLKTPASILGTFVVNVGINATVVAPTDGIYFNIAGNSLRGRCSVASSNTDSTTFTLSPATWYTLQIEYKATNTFEFKVFSAVGAELFSASVTAAVVIQNYNTALFASNTAGGASELISVDFMEYSGNRTR